MGLVAGSTLMDQSHRGQEGEEDSHNVADLTSRREKEGTGGSLQQHRIQH
jgi:hypothetical protein